jgi:hypothetical protein
MSQPLHPDFVRDLEAYSRTLFRRESLLIRIEARRLATSDPEADHDPRPGLTPPPSIER